MRKKVVIGVSAGVAVVALALGIGIGVAHQGPAEYTPAAESRPAKNGEVPAPPAPPQLRPSERVVVIGK
ncbi:hypothetical protein ABT297_33670 [Dactylosporangium sp. NPDC000555]|uniref:hypothetical protein n=1 Tax=Dactylosporangium sp. NPDC000555 TaxID=3154260 RepID=UPI00331BD433